MIIGLGNPSSDYQHTRHNAGQDLVDTLARQHSKPLSPNTKFFGLCSKIHIEGHDIHLLVPTTYMNRSGQALAALSKFYKIQPEHMLVVHDELDLAPGIARLKFAGGHGGHNGLRDIISALGNNPNFARLRIGIGHPGHASAVSNYVLKRASVDDTHKIQQASGNALAVINQLVKGEWDSATRTLHSNNK